MKVRLGCDYESGWYEDDGGGGAPEVKVPAKVMRRFRAATAEIAKCAKYFEKHVRPQLDAFAEECQRKWEAEEKVRQAKAAEERKARIRREAQLNALMPPAEWGKAKRRASRPVTTLPDPGIAGD